MGKLSVVVGAQYGSEAKGAAAGYLSNGMENGGKIVAGVRVGGPNAGHTVYGVCPPTCDGSSHTPGVPDTVLGPRIARSKAHPWKLQQVPVAAVTNGYARLLIAAGSEVEEKTLFREIDQLNAAGYDVSERLVVDQSATLLEPKHQTREKRRGLTGRLGSTAKGIGAARVDRLWREARTVGDEYGFGKNERFRVGDVESEITEVLTADHVGCGHGHVVLEGTQGYGLGIHTENYPYTTSGDCRAIDFMAQAGISPWADYVNDLDVWLVARTYPIRVAGNSGEMKDETDWGSLGVPAERTTVTNKIRRVGAWDGELVRRAAVANGAPNEKTEGRTTVRLALMMMDYEVPEVKNHTRLYDLSAPDIAKVKEVLREKEAEVGIPIEMIGTSPITCIDRRRPANRE